MQKTPPPTRRRRLRVVGWRAMVVAAGALLGVALCRSRSVVRAFCLHPPSAGPRRQSLSMGVAAAFKGE